MLVLLTRQDQCGGVGIRRQRAELRVGQKGDVRRTRSVQWRDPGDVDLGIADQLPAQAIDQVA